VVRINIKSGESATIHKSLTGPPMEFIGVKDGQYLYLSYHDLYIQPPESQDPVPMASPASRVSKTTERQHTRRQR
jgi:hypothetical protein